MTAQEDPDHAALTHDFRNWSIWRSKNRSGKLGDWWATRRRTLSSDEMWAGLAHTLSGESPAELRADLIAQRRLERAYRRELASHEPAGSRY